MCRKIICRWYNLISLLILSLSLSLHLPSSIYLPCLPLSALLSSHFSLRFLRIPEKEKNVHIWMVKNCSNGLLRHKLFRTKWNGEKCDWDQRGFYFGKWRTGSGELVSGELVSGELESGTWNEGEKG